MDRRISSTFEIPAASLQSIISIVTITFIFIYDHIIVPLFRNITKNPSGLTPLQRIGTGLFISMISMIISALVEIKRLNTAREFGLVDEPEAMVPMSLCWLIPQYILFGISDVFVVVGLRELFYDQVGDVNKNHACWERPEDMGTPSTGLKIDSSNPGSDIAAETAAA